MNVPSLFNPVFHNVCNSLTMQNVSPIVRIYTLQKNRKGFLFSFCTAWFEEFIQHSFPLPKAAKMHL